MNALSRFAHQITLKHICFLVVVIIVFAFQAHQLFSFNPYWGYDGGAHVNILETLLFEHRFPTLAENYLAWHEPLYYLVLVGLGYIGISFWFPHLLIIFAIDVLVFGLFRRMGHGNLLALFGTIAVISLPAFLEVGLYFTNEALNYVFLLAIMHTTLSLWREDRWSWKTSLLFSICAGLGAVTKITALVAFGVAVILLIIKMVQKRTWKYVLTILMAIVFIIGCYAPWYMVRSQSLSGISVNNYDMLPAKPLVLDERVGFMTRFDDDIFAFPFWYSGGTGFWSMLYADTVSDYLGLFENQDLKNALPAGERVMTTHNGNSVSAYRKPLAEAALRLGALPVAVMLFGILSALVALKKRKSQDALIVLGFSSAFLLALTYYAYRYPYYDQGVIKSIFIAPTFVLPLAFGLHLFRRCPKWVQAIGFTVWAAYITVVVALFFIHR
ncbi:MAG: glycosyltransferase family 39 protein [Patescibacteria group bacterium]